VSTCLITVLIAGIAGRSYTLGMGIHDQKTEIDTGEPIWYTSVATADELPLLAEPNARCRVVGENAIYLYFGGQWRKLTKPR
jgi:hypothetical protein